MARLRGSESDRAKWRDKPIPRYSETRFAWMRTASLEIVLYNDQFRDENKSPEGEIPSEEVDIYAGMDDMDLHAAIKPIRLMIKTGSRRYQSFNLMEWTEEELDGFQRLVNDACDLARPAIRVLDQVARDEFQAGQDDNMRAYRPDPVFVNRDKFRPDYGHLINDDGTVTNPTVNPDSTNKENDSESHGDRRSEDDPD